MTRLARILTLWLAIAGCHLDASGQELADPAMSARYRTLISEIRCPKCLNESIAESNAPLAGDMRRQVQRLISDGASDDEVKEFMASRYGEAVLYTPRLSPVTLALWVAPFAFLALGAVVFWRILAVRSSQPLDEELPP